MSMVSESEYQKVCDESWEWRMKAEAAEKWSSAESDRADEAEDRLKAARVVMVSDVRLVARFWHENYMKKYCGDFCDGLTGGRRMAYGTTLKILRDIRRAARNWHRPIRAEKEKEYVHSS